MFGLRVWYVVVICLVGVFVTGFMFVDAVVMGFVAC